MARINRIIQKSSSDPDNHDGMAIHLESDILECEVKWALESIDMNNANGGDLMLMEVMEFQLNYFKCQKIMLL